VNPKVLCVDDEPNVLAAFQRQLRREFALDTAEGGAAGLKALAASGPYAVVVSDLRMPGMDGIEFLSRVRQAAPDTVRIMLTGNADLSTAIDAVNEGAIFRFLTKPCPMDTLVTTIRAGAAQYRLVTAERELLEKTLTGSIKVLTDVLSLANPAAFGRAARVRRIVYSVAEAMGLADAWLYGIAAMLSQVGCVSLPEVILHKLNSGQPMDAEEQRLFEEHPGIGSELLANIPRLEPVAKIVAYQEKNYDGTGVPADDVKGDEIPLGARVLHAALHYDALLSAGKSSTAAVAAMQRRSGHYDPAIVSALAEVAGAESSWEERLVSAWDLAAGMSLLDDVTTPTGALVVCRGQEVTPSIRARLISLVRRAAVREPFRVLAPVTPMRGGDV